MLSNAEVKHMEHLMQFNMDKFWSLQENITAGVFVAKDADPLVCANYSASVEQNMSLASLIALQ